MSRSSCPERFLLEGGTRDRTAQRGRELEIKTVQKNIANVNTLTRKQKKADAEPTSLICSVTKGDHDCPWTHLGPERGKIWDESTRLLNP